MKRPRDNRFGAIAVRKGFITPSQLDEALAIQAKESSGEGQHRLLGQILLDIGALTPSQIDDVLETMKNAVMYVISAGR